MAAYDIGAAFAEIEDELINSMIRNMKRHRVEEITEELEWAQWQALQIEALEEYRRKNKKRFTGRFKEIDSRVDEAIKEARKNGQTQTEADILDAIKKGASSYTKQPEGVSNAFFRINSRKLDALAKATKKDFHKAEHALLRMANDQYRRTIFSAQVYANTGAGTYEKAVDMATKNMLQAGLNCVEYSNGARHTLRDYADMAIRTANTRAYLAGEAEMRESWGVHTVIVNKRSAACPRCMPFVGKIMIDDVYGNGSLKDGDYMLLSTAIGQGFLHPRCKDVYTTYFPELEDDDDTALSPKEKKELVEEDRQQEKEQYCERQAEKYDRMAKHSLDPENQQKYDAKAEKWGEEAEKLKPAEEPVTNDPGANNAVLDLEHSKTPAVDAQKKISPELQKEIDEALEYYVSGDGMFVNKHLSGELEKNGGLWTEEDEELLKLLDEATQEIVKQKKLWRSVDASAVFGDMSYIDYADLESYILYGESSVTPEKAMAIRQRLAIEGKEIIEPRFMSTTTDKDLALKWRDFTGSDKPIVLELDVPEGIKGVDLKRFDLPEDPQNEILLARGQKYRIKSIGAEDGQIVVKAELIPEGVAEPAEKNFLRNNMPRNFTDERKVGKPISEERLQAFLEKAKSKGIRIGPYPESTGNFELYCGDPDVLDDVLERLSKSMADAKEAGLLKPDADVILQYDNVLGYMGDNSAIDVGAFAETRGKTITLNKFMFDDSKYLEEQYAEAVESGLFARGTDYRNIIDHEFGHILDKQNPKLQNRIIDVLQKDAADANMNIEQYLVRELSIYSTSQSRKDGFCELIAELNAKKKGSDSAFVENVLRKAGVKL